MKYICTVCAKGYEVAASIWRCHCSGPLQLVSHSHSLSSIETADHSLWRYASSIPISREFQVSLGEGMTPLVKVELKSLLPFASETDFRFKLDYLMPSGSFKDRGAAVLISAARYFGVSRVIEDSSGNAGAAIATYAARAGLRATIFVPASTAEGKLRQIAACGAELVRIEGPREAVAEAAQEAAGEAFYASHVWNPFFFQGTKTLAYEIFEQLGNRAPDAIIAPCGNGTMILGLYIGFKDLLSSNRIHRLPRLLAVQAQGYDPICRAFNREQGAPHGANGPSATVAGGIAIRKPARKVEIVKALEESDGSCIIVKEQEILDARERLCRSGFYVEPTSATALAALVHVGSKSGALAVVVLTGSGLKA